MKIGIIGSNGFIGRNLNFYFKDSKKINVKCFSSYKKNKSKWIKKISKEINLFKPEIIINCAADQNSKDNDKDIVGLINSNLMANALFLNQATKNKNLEIKRSIFQRVL